MLWNIGGGDRRARRASLLPLSPTPHFCWTMLARKDQNTLIEQSATLIEQSTTISLKAVGSYFSNIVKVSKNRLSEFLNVKIF